MSTLTDMQTIRSSIQTRSQAFKDNQLKMQGLSALLQEYLAQSRFQGEDKYLERHRKAGKLTARERVELLLDPDSPFLELMPMAGWCQRSTRLWSMATEGAPKLKVSAPLPEGRNKFRRLIKS